MYNDTVECPYCEHDNDMTDALCDGLSSDNTLDWECENCEREFEVYVDFEPSYSASKIEYVKCEECGREERDICKKGKIFPWPASLNKNNVCRGCFYEARRKEMSK